MRKLFSFALLVLVPFSLLALQQPQGLADKVPSVADNTVYLFPGDNFGINVVVTGDEISAVTYQKDTGKADVTFKFTPEKGPNGAMMLLVLKSKLKRQLFLDAFMTVPGRKGVYKTSILPVGPGLSNVESWPHPIVQLTLKNFRFRQTSNKPD